MRQECEDVLTFETNHVSDYYQCDRKAGHKGKHRQRFYGDDGRPFGATLRWRRRTVRPPE